MKCVIEGVELHYEIRGEGRPLLMVHGFPIDHRALSLPLEPVMEEQDGWQRIYVDLPGMGQSTSHDDIKNTDDILRILCGFVDHLLGPEQTFTLFGYSYGGYLAQGMAYQIPERLDGIGLLCPVVIAPHQDRTLPESICFERDDAFMESIPAADREEFELNGVIHTKEAWDRTQAELQSGMDASDDAFCDRLVTQGYSLTFPIQKLPNVFEKPALILLGRQDNIVGWRDQMDIIDSYSRASVALLDRAGHHLQIEQDPLFKQMFLEWLNRVAELSAP